MKPYILKSFKGAISDYEDKGIEGSFKFGANLDVRKKVDSLSAGQKLSDDLAVGGIMTALAIAIVTASDGSTYFFCKDGKIIKRTSGGVYSLVHTDAEPIVGAEEWYNNVGDTFLNWTTATKLHRKRIIGVGYVNAEPWADVDANVNGQAYPKVNLTSAAWHVLKQVNGALLGGNADKLLLVGYDDSYTPNAVQLFPGYTAKPILERKTNVVAGVNKNDSSQISRLFKWDGGTSQNYNDVEPIPIASINALIDTEVPIMQVGTNGQLYYADFYDNLPITAFPGGGSVNPYGVELDNGLALFGVFGNGAGKTGVYSYGRKKKNAPFVLNCEYQIDVTEIGALKKVGTTLLISVQTAGGFGVKKVDSTLKANGIYESLDLPSPFIPQRAATWDYIVLKMAALPASCSVKVARKLDKAGSFIYCDSDAGNAGDKTVFDTAGATEAVFKCGDLANVFELRVETYSNLNTTPEVYQAEIYLE